MRGPTEVKRLGRRTLGMLLAALAVAALASPAFGQEEARWLPWVGCWEEIQPAAGPSVVCFRPVEGGVEMLSVAEGEVVATESFSGDGRSHVLEEEGCVGRRSGVFSGDGRRLFLEAELTCDGEYRRESSGLMAMTSQATWIEVQSVDVGGRNMAWVRRYRLAAPELTEEAGLSGLTAGREMAVTTARYAASAPVEVGDVVEASERVDQEAVRAWVAELRDPFGLDADRLVALADAGVDPDVIDVMVAVSYPDRFTVDHSAADVERVADDYDRVRRDYGPCRGYRGTRFFDPFHCGVFGFGVGYNPYYSAYGAGYYGGGYYGGGYFGPTVVVVRPSGGTSSTRGRLVKGRGYTRGGGGAARGGGQTSVRGTSGSSGASAGAPTGSKGSSTGRSTGRKAKPRGGGGGGGGLF